MWKCKLLDSNCNQLKQWIKAPQGLFTRVVLTRKRYDYTTIINYNNQFSVTIRSKRVQKLILCLLAHNKKLCILTLIMMLLMAPVSTCNFLSVWLLKKFYLVASTIAEFQHYLEALIRPSMASCLRTSSICLD